MISWGYDVMGIIKSIIPPMVRLIGIDGDQAPKSWGEIDRIHPWEVGSAVAQLCHSSQQAAGRIWLKMVKIPSIVLRKQQRWSWKNGETHLKCIFNIFKTSQIHGQSYPIDTKRLVRISLYPSKIHPGSPDFCFSGIAGLVKHIGAEHLSLQQLSNFNCSAAQAMEKRRCCPFPTPGICCASGRPLTCHRDQIQPGKMLQQTHSCCQILPNTFNCWTVGSHTVEVVWLSNPPPWNKSISL